MDEILSSYVEVAKFAKSAVPLKVQLRLAKERWVFWRYGKVEATV